MRLRVVLALCALVGCRSLVGIEDLEIGSDGASTADGADDAPGAPDARVIDGDPDAVSSVLTEIEPNGTRAEADATAIVVRGDARIDAPIAFVGDSDYFRLELGALAIIRFEVFDPGGDDCLSINPYLRIHDPITMLFSDDDSGISLCPAMVRALPAGVYYVEVGSSAAYLLEIELLDAAGTEVEPNEPCSNGSAIVGSDVFITGNHEPAGNYVDYFELVVPPGASLRAEVVEGGVKGCDALEMDPILTLYSPTATLLAEDDDGGRGDCSLIDGTGSSPAHVGANTLPAGTYCLRVNAPGTATPSTANFEYRLQVTLR